MNRTRAVTVLLLFLVLLLGLALAAKAELKSSVSTQHNRSRGANPYSQSEAWDTATTAEKDSVAQLFDAVFTSLDATDRADIVARGLNTNVGGDGVSPEIIGMLEGLYLGNAPAEWRAELLAIADSDTSLYYLHGDKAPYTNTRLEAWNKDVFDWRQPEVAQMFLDVMSNVAYSDVSAWRFEVINTLTDFMDYGYDDGDHGCSDCLGDFFTDKDGVVADFTAGLNDFFLNYVPSVGKPVIAGGQRNGMPYRAIETARGHFYEDYIVRARNTGDLTNAEWLKEIWNTGSVGSDSLAPYVSVKYARENLLNGGDYNVFAMPWHAFHDDDQGDFAWASLMMSVAVGDSLTGYALYQNDWWACTDSSPYPGNIDCSDVPGGEATGSLNVAEAWPAFTPILDYEAGTMEVSLMPSFKNIAATFATSVAITSVTLMTADIAWAVPSTPTNAHIRPVSDAVSMHVVVDPGAGGIPPYEYGFKFPAATGEWVWQDSTRYVKDSLTMGTAYDCSVKVRNSVDQVESPVVLAPERYTWEAPAVGGGAAATGGLYAPLYRVTSLAETYALGTVRDALDDFGGEGRYIIFDVGGTFTATASIDWFDDNMTLDAYSAPTPVEFVSSTALIGTGPVIRIDARSGRVARNGIARGVIVHGVSNTAEGRLYDTISVGGDGAGDFGTPNDPANAASLFVIDHCAAYWYNDDGINVINGAHEVTVQYSLTGIRENNKAFLLGNNYLDFLENVTVYKCIASAESRLPMFHARQEGLEVVNNIFVHTHGQSAEFSKYASHDDGTGYLYPNNEIDFVSNFYMSTPKEHRVGNPFWIWGTEAESGILVDADVLAVRPTIYTDGNMAWHGDIQTQHGDEIGTAAARWGSALSGEVTASSADIATWIDDFEPKHTTAAISSFVTGVAADIAADRSSYLADTTPPTVTTFGVANPSGDQLRFDVGSSDASGNDCFLKGFMSLNSDGSDPDSTQWEGDGTGSGNIRYVYPGAGTWYCWATVKDKNGNVSDSSDTLSIVIGAPTPTDFLPPSTPFALTATGETFTSIDLEWAASTDDSTSQADILYAFYYHETEAADTSLMSRTTWAAAAPSSGTSSRTLTPLTADTAYNIFVAAKDLREFDGAPNGRQSAVANTPLTHSTSGVGTVEPCSNGCVYLTGCGGSVDVPVEATFTGDAWQGFAFEIECSCTIGDTSTNFPYQGYWWAISTNSDMSDSTAVQVDSNTWTVEGLTPSTNYYVQVFAYVDATLSAGSTIGGPFATDALPATPPSTPTGLVVTDATDAYSLTVGWDAVAGVDTTMILINTVDNSATADSVQVVGSSALYVDDLTPSGAATPITPSQTVYFWARAMDDGLVSALTASINGASAVIPAPAIRSGTGSDQQATLIWFTVEGVDTWEVDETTGGPGATDATGIAAATLGYTDTGLTNDTTYTYRVRGVSNGTPGPYSVSTDITPTGPVGTYKYMVELNATTLGIDPVDTINDSIWVVLRRASVASQEFTTSSTVNTAALTEEVVDVTNNLRRWKYTELTNDPASVLGDWYVVDGTGKGGNIDTTFAQETDRLVWTENPDSVLAVVDLRAKIGDVADLTGISADVLTVAALISGLNDLSTADVRSAAGSALREPQGGAVSATSVVGMARESESATASTLSKLQSGVALDAAGQAQVQAIADALQAVGDGGAWGTNPTLMWSYLGALNDILRLSHGADSWVTATEIDSTRAVGTAWLLDEDIASGLTLSIGNGAYDHWVHVMASVDSSDISGARVTVRSSDGATLQGHGNTSTTGVVPAHLDAATYAWSASNPTSHGPTSGTLTVTGDGDTTAVYLTPLTVSAPDSVDLVTVYFDVGDLGVYEALQDIEICANFEGDGGVVGDYLIGYRPECDTTDALGHAEITLPIESAILVQDGDHVWSFSFTDVSTSAARRANPVRIDTFDDVVVNGPAGGTVKFVDLVGGE